MIRLPAFILLLTTSAFGAGPFIGPEERIATLRSAIDLTLVRSADTTLLAWNEDSHVKARVNGTTITLGTGIHVRADTDGRDFQIIWTEQSRVAGALWSNPSDVRTLVNLNTFMHELGTFHTKPATVAWNGTRFEVFSGLNAPDVVDSLAGVVLTARATSQPAHQECAPSLFLGFFCREVPASYRIDLSLRSATEFRGFTTAQGGFSSTLPPGLGAAGDEFLLVWKSPAGIDGFRIRRDGSTAGFINVPIGKAMTGKRGPQVAWDGTRYLIVFDTLDASGDIWGAVVTPGPTYIAEPFVIAGSAENELAPAVTALGADRFLVAYTLGHEWIVTREISFREPLPSRRRALR